MQNEVQGSNRQILETATQDCPEVYSSKTVCPFANLRHSVADLFDQSNKAHEITE